MNLRVEALMFWCFAADHGAVGGTADEAVQHVAERVRVVLTAHGAQQLVARADTDQVS